MASEKVLLSGASGFIAGYILKQLIEDGFYVIGTVRSESKGEFLKKLYPKNFEYAIVKDIAEPNAFDAIFKANPDIEYVQHTASPAMFNVTSAEKDFLLPAIQGTLSMLKGAKSYGSNVKKVVVTSSFAAVMQVISAKYPNIVYTEDSWNNITYKQASDDSNLLFAYVGSKALAEKAAWEFIETEKPKFALSTVQIPSVWGPPINDINLSNLNTSNGIIAGILSLSKDATEFDELFPYWVDVRDASRTHIRAMTSAELDNKRVLFYSGITGTQPILDILHKVRPEFAANLPIGKPGNFDEKVFSPIDNSRTKRVVSFKPTSLETTLADVIDWIVANKEKNKEY